MPNARVLIVGAGPTGLNLALSLARRGVPFRLISEAEGPGEHSRAMVVQARTLEFYDQFGFADEVVRQGIPAGEAHLREGGENGRSREVVSVSFRDLGQGLSPYPFPALSRNSMKWPIGAGFSDLAVSVRSAVEGFSRLLLTTSPLDGLTPLSPENDLRRRYTEGAHPVKLLDSMKVERLSSTLRAHLKESGPQRLP
jgi:hypothetical protein